MIGIDRKKLATGPPAPTSRSMMRLIIGDRSLMNAPKVPIRLIQLGAGMKYGGETFIR
jgi:hypothetical protein